MPQQFRSTAFLAGVVLLLLGSSGWAQTRYTHEAEENTIKQVKNLLASSLDHRLPKVTLEFFLQYEGAGAPIEWSIGNCDWQVNQRPDDTICVQAEIELKDNRSAVVVVSVKKPETGSSPATSISSVTVTDQSGSVHEVPRLGDLPMELHRRLPRLPRDLPPPAAEA